MAALAKGLPVFFIPEQMFIPSMRDDVIHNRRRGEDARLQALGAEWISPQVSVTGSPPFAVISALCCTSAHPVIRDFDVCRSVLPLGRVILAHGAEHIPDDLFLPGQQLEGLSMKLSLGVLQGFDEADDALGFSLIKGHVTTPPSAVVPWDRLKRGTVTFTVCYRVQPADPS